MKIIATSDWHLSTNRPVCRTDNDWVDTQAKHLSAVFNECKQDIENTQIVVAGDVFDTPTVAPVLTNLVVGMANVLKNMEFIAGNHDLPWHAADRIEESSFGTIRTIRDRKEGMFDFGTIHPSDIVYDFVAVHTFTVPTEKDKPPMREAKTAQDLCDMFPNTPIIIVGDNHEHWCRKIGKQLVVNCGTLIQRTASEAKRPCGYYIIDTDTLEADYHDLSDLSEGCIDTTYLDNIKEKEQSAEKYDALIQELLSHEKQEYDFMQALEIYAKENKLTKECSTIFDELLVYIKEK